MPVSVIKAIRTGHSLYSRFCTEKYILISCKTNHVNGTSLIIGQRCDSDSDFIAFTTFTVELINVSIMEQ